MKTPITRTPIADLIPLLNGRESLSFFITNRPPEIQSVWRYARDRGLGLIFLDGYFTIKGIQRRFYDMILVKGLIWADCGEIWNSHMLDAVLYIVDEAAFCRSHTKNFRGHRPSSITELELLIGKALNEGRRFIIDSSHRAPSAGTLEGRVLHKNGHW